MAETDHDASLTDERLVHPLSLFREQQGLNAALAPTTPGDRAALRDGVVRWLPDGLSTDALMPSFSLADPSLATAGGAPANEPAVVVRFGHTRDSRHLVEVAVEASTTLHGVGMHAAPLERRGRVYTCWNTDFPEYDDDNPSLYQSHPFVFCVRADGSAFGLLFDTTFRADIDLRDATTVRARAEGPAFAVYVLEAPSPRCLSERLAEITGPTPLLPRWALGYHQCRWSYYPAGRALHIAEEFRSRQIPCDVLWFDIHYMQDYRIFTYHEERYPDPESVNVRLHAMGFRSVWMIDPAPKQMSGDPVYDSGLAGDHFTLASNGQPFVGSVWAGPSCFPDFTREATRRWWANLYRDFLATGVDGVWNDMNEPSVFDAASKTMPVDCWHRGDETLPAGPHAMYHNVYGLLMVRASREGILAARPDRRPFLLTRANFLGGHRYAATWTGDNAATWTDLARSIPMVLSLSLSGQLVSGPDIGGFADRTEGDGRLFARWMGIGCLLPFARAHAAQGTIDKEPWSFGPSCEATCRRAIERRYRLLPYLYTCAWWAHRRGAPIAAPVFFGDPTDPALREEDRALIIGEDLLAICDVLPPGAPASTPVATPGGWAPFELGEEDPELPELRLRPGAAIPTGPVIQHSDAQPDAPLTLLACLDATGHAEGWLYEDDGDGHDHERGNYRLTRLVVAADGTLTEHHVEGNRPASRRAMNAVVVGRAGGPPAHRRRIPDDADEGRRRQ